MTPTLIFWIRIGIIILLIYGAWDLFRNIKKQKRFLPVTPEEWKRFLPDIMFLGLGVFFLFWLENNFQKQIDIVISEKNKTLPALYFTNQETGQPDSLAAYKGKIVVLNIWATWCAPCKRELPSLEKLAANYKDQLVVLALSDENSDVVKEYKDKTNYQLVMGSYSGHPVLDSLTSRPVSILLDKNNLVQDVAVGAREYSFFRKWVESYTAAK